MLTILIIDDHSEFRELVGDMLRISQYQVIEARCPEEAFPLLQDMTPDIILCDLFMPFSLGEEREDYQYSYNVGIMTAEELRWALPNVPLIVTSSAVPNDIRSCVGHIEGVHILPKPFQMSQLRGTIELALTTHDNQLQLN